MVFPTCPPPNKKRPFRGVGAWEDTLPPQEVAAWLRCAPFQSNYAASIGISLPELHL
jgi:hypothetical protein